MKRVIIPKEAAGKELLPYLSSLGIFLSADCGGAGKCGKCRVALLEGELLQKKSSGKTLIPDENGTLLACMAICSPKGAVIGLGITEGEGLTVKQNDTTISSLDSDSEWGVALDIGTTTLAMASVDLKTGKTVATVSRLNPQRCFGADVMNRISACTKGHLKALQKLILDAVAEMIEELSTHRNGKAPKKMTVAANPTMLHLFAGISPEGMGAYPFTPVFLSTKVYKGEELGLKVEEITLLPSASSFVGSDITAGVMLTKMREQDEPTVLMDIGTNGEIVLSLGKKRGGKLYATSTAAGPALEGAGISCGIGGVAGTISKVMQTENGFTISTVENKSPIGICGSGLIDAVAYLLDTSLLDETGYLEEEPFILASGENGDISLSQEDIRAFQLAKSALRAGLETLVAENGLCINDISKLYLAGGLGFYMDCQSAMKVGLLPPVLDGKVEAIGNSSLKGAMLALYLPSKVKEIEDIAEASQTISLQNSPIFNEAYIEHMLFPMED